MSLTKRSVRPDTVGLILIMDDDLVVDAPISIRYLRDISVAEGAINANFSNVQNIGSGQEADLVEGAKEKVIGAACHSDTMPKLCVG